MVKQCGARVGNERHHKDWGKDYAAEGRSLCWGGSRAGDTGLEVGRLC